MTYCRALPISRRVFSAFVLDISSYTFFTYYKNLASHQMAEAIVFLVHFRSYTKVTFLKWNKKIEYPIFILMVRIFVINLQN